MNVPNETSDAELWAKIAPLRITARSLADSVMAGGHPSRRIGTSVDFAEHREYRPGDDPRTLDSRVYARTDRWVVRRFEHESEIRAALALDTSGSMQFRGDPSRPTKLEHARRILLGLGYLMLRQGDRVSGHDLVRGAEGVVRGTSGLTQLERLRDLFSVEREGSVASMSTALADLVTVASSRSLVAIASDAIDEESSLDELSILRAAGHVVVFFHVLDPFELELPLDGAHEFVGLEGEGRVVADPSIVREAYLREVAGFLERIRDRCARAGAAYLLARTDEGPERVLSDLAAMETFA